MYLLSSSGLYILSGSALYNLSRVLFLCIFIILVLNFGVLKFWRCCAICSFVKLLEGSVLKLVELEMGVVVCSGLLAATLALLGLFITRQMGTVIEDPKLMEVITGILSAKFILTLCQ